VVVAVVIDNTSVYRIGVGREGKKEDRELHTKTTSGVSSRKGR